MKNKKLKLEENERLKRSAKKHKLSDEEIEKQKEWNEYLFRN